MSKDLETAARRLGERFSGSGFEGLVKF